MAQPFPRLLPDDAAVLQRYLDKFGNQYTYLLYDVRVGLGRDVGVQDLPATRDMAIDLTQRRIDAVGQTKNEIHILEVTRIIGLKAIGQYFAYPCLYIRTFRPGLPVKPIIVAEDVQSDIQTCIIDLNINIQLV